ncbi:MAG: hypothetical protein WCD36_01730 [Rhodanobacteraceae bacterium]
MKLRSSPFWLLLALLLQVAPAAAELRWHADSLAVPGIKAHDVTLELGAAAGGELALDIKAAGVDVTALGWHGVTLDSHGTLARPGTRRWHFKGKLALQGAAGGALRNAMVAIDFDDEQNSLGLALQQQDQQIHVDWPLDDLGHMQVRLTRLPLGWLQGLLTQVWGQGRFGKGQLSATLSVDVTDSALRSAGRFDLRQSGFDSRDGSIAAQGMSSDGHWSLDSRTQRSTLDLDAQMHGGELLLGPLYAKLPDSTARLRLKAGFSAGAVQLDDLHFDDGQSLRFDGALGFDSQGNLEQARIDAIRAVFPQAYDHYAKAALDTAGFPGMSLRGMLTGSLVWGRSGWQRFALDADGLDVRDPSQRIGMDGLTGRLDWSRSGERESSRLSWNALKILHLDLGAGSSQWQSAQGTLSLMAPATIPMMGGQVFLNSLQWSPEAEKRQNRVAASIAYSGIDLARLSTAFDWPAFKGTVGGAIPGLKYDGQRLELDGGVSVNVFDGFVDVTRLALQNPFGAAPVLTAAVGFRDIDLKPMTQVFDFGNISGRLKGQINDLRMINWRPVAFAASLRANDGGRISQKAVNSISNLGGGGIGGGLQSAMLKVFDSFGYSKIGLDCVLRDNVCTMGGLAPADGGGYTIVQGRGLPHIAVIGHQHQVDWSTLVARLEAATSGGGVKIQ